MDLARYSLLESLVDISKYEATLDDIRCNRYNGKTVIFLTVEGRNIDLSLYPKLDTYLFLSDGDIQDVNRYSLKLERKEYPVKPTTYHLSEISMIWLKGIIENATCTFY